MELEARIRRGDFRSQRERILERLEIGDSVDAVSDLQRIIPSEYRLQLAGLCIHDLAIARVAGESGDCIVVNSDRRTFGTYTKEGGQGVMYVIFLDPKTGQMHFPEELLTRLFEEEDSFLGYYRTLVAAPETVM